MYNIEGVTPSIHCRAPSYLNHGYDNSKFYGNVTLSGCEERIMGEVIEKHVSTNTRDISLSVGERVIIICSRDGSKPPYLIPTHSNDSQYKLPKWKRYGSSGYGCRIGQGNVAVVVEDCISACRLHSINMTGVAILGTSLKQSYIPTMRKFKKLYVCLDKDATSKAFDIANELMYYVDTEVKILDDDIKYLNQEELKELFQ